MANDFNVESSRNKRGILIVEDNDINREMLKSILQERYRVFEAVDGLDGIEKLRENYRDLSLILLDVQMPRMNGYEFLEQHAKDEVLSGIPVIVTTGSTITEDEEKCLALGASDFVTKPYNPRIIARRIEAIIRLRESIATLQAVEFDSLSGLYTKPAFLHHAQKIFSAGGAEKFDMVMIDIDDFSYINELYGTLRSNELLKHIGNVLAVCNLDALICCRNSGDRFAILRRHTDSDIEKEIVELDERIHNGAPIPGFLLKFAVYQQIDTSLPIDTISARLLAAMKTIKRQYHLSVAFYSDEMAQKAKRLKQIEECMREALTERQYAVYYQPKHDAQTGALAGAEALVRWTHPQYGFLSPDDFIPLFEENGFITDLDLYVWNTVCEDIKSWKDSGITPVPISVNASRRDLLLLESPEKLFVSVNQNDVDIDLLHLEITESASVNDSVILERVKAIRDTGIQIELDDFGSGQSSLGTIRDIPVDVIKLDMSFVRNIEKQKEIVKMIISLAHALGHKTVAEGVETREQFMLLRQFGCDYVQGYYFSKPLPQNEFREYLKNSKR